MRHEVNKIQNKHKKERSLRIATLKRVYYYRDSNKLVLQSENPVYPPFVYSDEELNSIRILGKAIAFQSDVK